MPGGVTDSCRRCPKTLAKPLDHRSQQLFQAFGCVRLAPLNPTHPHDLQMKTDWSTLLRELVAFDTTSRHSNLALIDYVQHYLTEFGIDSELVFDSTGSKANLFASIGPDHAGGVMLSGHTDVVPVDGQDWDSDPFSVTEKDALYFGRGTADMKGFIACVLSVVPHMTSLKLQSPIHIALSYDEEIGCLGVRRLIEMLSGAPMLPRMAVIGEPTSMQVVCAHKGKRAFRVSVDGRSAHSAYPTDGVNAIDYAVDLISRIHQLQADIRVHGPFDQSYRVPNTTLHVGTIRGGSALNIVPENCVFEFEIRHLPEQDIDELVDAISNYASETLVPAMQTVDPGTGIVIESLTRYPGLATNRDEPVVGFVQSLLSGEKSTEKISFGSEAGLFKDGLGIPGVVCGPGSIQQAHRPNEYVSIEQLNTCAGMIQRLVDRLAENRLPV